MQIADCEREECCLTLHVCKGILVDERKSKDSSWGNTQAREGLMGDLKVKVPACKAWSLPYGLFGPGRN